MTEQIAESNPPSRQPLDEKEARAEILKQAGSLLLDIHHAVAAEAQTQDQNTGQLTFDSSLYSAIMGLVDLLTIEGIYPALPRGFVNVDERRKKSLLYSNVPRHTPLPDNLHTSHYVIGEVFNPIVLGGEQGAQYLLRERFLIDVVAGNTFLAFAPDGSTNEYFESQLNGIIHEMPTPTAFRVLTSFLNVPAGLEWLRKPLGEKIAVLIIRPKGVRHLIEFIATTFPPTSTSTSSNQSSASHGPTLSIEALAHVGQLIIATPKKHQLESWLSFISPQLWSLLDGEDGKEFSSAAAYIIGSGILGKRSSGAPGSPGWEVFAAPLLSTINPPESAIQFRFSSPADGTASSNDPVELVPQADLDTALRRLATLVTSHPHAGVTARLVRPLILPLWALANYSASPITSRFYRDTSFELLQTYFSLSGSLAQLEILAEHVAWSGPAEWTFGPGSNGGVAIRSRPLQQEEFADVFSTIHGVDARIQRFIDLISSAAIEDTSLSSLFLSLTRKWLVKTADSKEGSNSLLESEDDDPLKTVATAQLVQAMLTKFQDRLLQDPIQLLELIQQVLQEAVDSIRSKEDRKRSLKKPTISALSSIVADDTTPASAQSAIDFSTLLTSQSDTLEVVNSLLQIILQEPNKRLQESGSKTTLNAVQNQLQKILQSIPPNEAALTTSLTRSQSLISSLLSPLATPSTGQSSSTAPQQQQQNKLPTLTHIQEELNSPLPPIRASALADLDTLVKAPEIPVNTPSTTLLLLSVIRTDSEEFVYLRAMRTLTLLVTTRDTGFAVRMVADAFQDVKEESGVDGRLRVGEALSSIIDGLAVASSVKIDGVTRGTAVCTISEVALVVAGRRGRRTKELRERERTERLEKEKMRKAEEAWGGEVPAFPESDDEDGEQNTMTDAQKAKTDKELAAMETIVKGWQDTGYEEDVRLRASAMSIVGLAVEKFTGMLGAKLVGDTVDMAMSILGMEQNGHKAIVRRASVLVFMALLKALDSAHDKGKDLNVSLGPEKWTEIEKVLRWTSEMDDDDITKGHAEAVLESLENWRMKQLMALGEESPRLGLEGRLRGLAVSPAVQETPVKRRIEEIE